MVVSEGFYKAYRQEIEAEGFGFTEFPANDRETQLYLLVLPVLPPQEFLHKPTQLLINKMNVIKQDVQKIRTLGGFYPDLSMEEQFIRLKLTPTALPQEAKPAKSTEDEQERDILSQRESKRSTAISLNCDEIYDNYPHLLIKGIPGVGKTTILNYFCFRAFASNQYALFVRCLEFPNINQWKQEYHYVSVDNITRFMIHLATFAFIHPNKTYNEINREEKGNFTEMAKMVLKWVEEGKIVFCLDALDEVTNPIQQREILQLVTR